MKKLEKFGALEKKYLNEVIDSGNLFYVNGEKTKNLIKAIQKYFNIQHAAVMSSGTAAIHAAVAALELPPGSEVITTPITDMGTVIGVLYQNLIPIFADLDPNTYNMTAETIRKVITSRTKAIIVVHLAGNPAEMQEIITLAKEKNLRVIEDCAQSYGAKYKGKKIGTMGDIGCYSLNAYKHISCGDGGFIITDSEELWVKTVNYADKYYDRLNTGERLVHLAPNYRFTELQAAVALAQFSKVDEFVEIHHNLGKIWNDGISDLPGIIPHLVKPENFCSYWFSMLRVEPKVLGVTREAFVKMLNSEKIEASAGYIPHVLYMEPLFANKSFFPGNIWPVEKLLDTPIKYTKGLCPVAEEILETAVKIPINIHINSEEIRKKAENFRKIVLKLTKK